MPNHINTTNPINALVAINNFGHYKAGDKQIAHTLLSGLRDIPESTIEQVSVRCNVSVSTFQRFYRDIGYGSYSEFKLKIAAALDAHIDKNAYIDHRDLSFGLDPINALLIQARTSIEQLESSLDRSKLENLARSIHGADKVFIHDTFFSNEKLLFQGDLALTEKTVTFSLLTEDQQADLKALDETSFLLAMVGNSSRYREIVSEIPLAAKSGAAIGVLSLSPTFPHVNLCDHYLPFSGVGNSLDIMTEGLIFNMLSIVYRQLYLL